MIWHVLDGFEEAAVGRELVGDNGQEAEVETRSTPVGATYSVSSDAKKRMVSASFRVDCLCFVLFLFSFFVRFKLEEISEALAREEHGRAECSTRAGRRVPP